MIKKISKFLSIPPVITLFSNQSDHIDRKISQTDQKRLFHNILSYHDGLLLAGTTGYGPMLNDGQYRDLIALALNLKKSTFTEKLIFIGAIAVSKAKVKALIKNAVAVEEKCILPGQGGIDAFVVSPQSFFYRQTQAEIIAAMKDIAKFAACFKKAIFLYNISRSGALLKPETIQILKKVPNIVGIKDSSGDYSLYKKYLAFQDHDFKVFQGKPQFDLQTFADKGDGIVDANANFAPTLMKAVLDFYQQGELKKARELHERVYDATRYLNHKHSMIAENRLASRIAQLYLLDMIDYLPVLLERSELQQIAQGLTRNRIPKFSIQDGIIKPNTVFTMGDYQEKIDKIEKFVSMAQS